MLRILLSFRTFHASKAFASPISVNNRLLCSNSDDENPTKKTTSLANKSKNNEAVNKLNSLLQQIVEADQTNKHKLNLARPKGRNAKTEPGVKSAKVESVDQRIVSAVKGVAASLGGNKNQTESELLNRLINGEEKMPIENLSDIVRGMKIDRETKSENTVSRAQHVRMVIESSKQAAPHQRSPRTRPLRQPTIDAASAEPIDIFGEEPLGIFTSTDFKPSTQTINRTWNKLQERELKLTVTHPPLNYFQEQILWMEQGKIWKFPIDNEQGMVEEQKVYFAEHVFLEEHLSPWCPEKGPLRHFMELVCVGLSKNSYMSVQDKKEHIRWFQEYFEGKKKLLRETGAIPDDVSPKKQLENNKEL